MIYLYFPELNPVALYLGPINIYWYGLTYLFGFTLIYILSWLRLKYGIEKPISFSELSELIYYGTLGVIIGGRLGYVIFYQAQYYFNNLIEILFIWKGGMSFHGGMIGVIIVIWQFSQKKGLSFFLISDFFSSLIPLALGIGRIGNFINGELWGRPTTLPWGMVFLNAMDRIPRHPSQLYESILEGFVLFVLLRWFSKRKPPIGQISSIFLIGYGILRFIVEFTRQPDSYLGLFIFNLSLGQLLSIPMIIIGIAIYFVAQKAKRCL